MWFKKKSQISGFNANTGYNGIDWRTNGNGDSWSVSQTLPSAADAGNYFYLPALGWYNTGMLVDVDNNGYYWSSSASSGDSHYAYHLFFYSGGVSVDSFLRKNGLRVEPIFE